MLTSIRHVRDRLTRWIRGSGSQPAPIATDTNTNVPGRPLRPAPSRHPVAEHSSPSRWTVTEHPASPFEKCGRLYLQGDDVVVRSDCDGRGYCIPLADMAGVLDGETKPLLLLPDRTPGGTVRLSASRKAVNFRAGEVLYTSPVGRVRDVLAGRARKAAVFGERGSHPGIH